MIFTFLIVFYAAVCGFPVQAASITTAFYNTTIMKNGHIELVITEFTPTENILLQCGFRVNSILQVIAKYNTVNKTMNVNTQAGLKVFGYDGRASVKNNFTIVITNVTFKDQGTIYECDISNLLGFDTENIKHTLTLVLDPPSLVSSSFLSTVKLKEGDSLSLSCNISGNPAPEVQWIKESIIAGSIRQIATTGQDGYFVESYFVNNSISWLYHGKQITCKGNNTGGTIEETTKLNVTFSPKNTTIFVSQSAPKENKVFTVKCNAVSNPAVAKYIISSPLGIFETTTGSHRFNAGICSTGWYSCTAFSSLGNGTTKSTNVTIDGKPTISTKPISEEITEGGNASFTCTEVGCPHPDVRWRKVSDSNNSILHSGNTYTITNVNRNHTGVYICEAIHGNKSDEANVTLTVQYMPENFALAPLSGNVVNGKRLQINCSANGIPAPMYTFYRMFQDGTNVTVTSTRSDATGKLVVDSVSYESVGDYKASYKCVVSNVLGEKKGSAEFNVHVPPTNISVTPSNIVKNETQDVVLQCSVSAVNPAANFTWVKDSTSVILSRNSTLILRGLTRQQTGTYHCNASNGIGSSRASSIVTVQYIRKTTTGPDDVNSNAIIAGLSSALAISILLNIVFAIVIFILARIRKKEKGNTNVPRVLANEDISLTNVALTEDHATYAEVVTATYAELQSTGSSDHASGIIWETPRSKVIVEKTIGQGAFGQVAEAKLLCGFGRSIEWKIVAVKMIKGNASEKEQKGFLDEISIMKRLPVHKNVLSLIGCITQSAPFYAIVEFMQYGDLLGFIRKRRGLEDEFYRTRTDQKQALSSVELVGFAADVARGMAFLATHKIVHRDLAARNVLVGKDQYNKTICKVNDFGFARNIANEDLYTKTTAGRIPVKWTALESLTYGVYTSQSDVWSFGVVLFEIFTLGAVPYQGMKTRDLPTKLQSGFRMPKPKHVSDDIYEIMVKCWSEQPERRPVFSTLERTFSKMEHQTVDYINLKDFNSALYSNFSEL